ncbi:MAG TPA: type II toxin-antitoxin system VapC family toxin [Iamia sp.]
MALTYFDSSALMKLVIDEPGSDEARALWDGSDARLASRLAHPEVRAAMAALRRNHQLDDDGLLVAEEVWSGFWDDVRPVELTEDVGTRAGDLAGVHSLRGADAVHLASALALGPEVIVAVWDRRLQRACRAEGLAVLPAVIPLRT